MASAAPLKPTVEQLKAAYSILRDENYYDEENDKFTVYFRTQEEAHKFSAVLQQLTDEPVTIGNMVQ